MRVLLLESYMATSFMSRRGIWFSSKTKPLTPLYNQPIHSRKQVLHENHISKRHKSQPRYLDDFVVNLPPLVDHAPPSSNQRSSTIHPIANFIAYGKWKITDSDKAFLSAANDEPKHFR